jgi:hypothetical protein
VAVRLLTTGRTDAADAARRLVEAAEEAMFFASRNGRNRVEA